MNELFSDLFKIANSSSELRSLAVEVYESYKRAAGSKAKETLQGVVESAVKEMAKGEGFKDFDGKAIGSGENKAIAQLMFSHDVAGPCTAEFFLEEQEDGIVRSYVKIYCDRELVGQEDFMGTVTEIEEKILPALMERIENQDDFKG